MSSLLKIAQYSKYHEMGENLGKKSAAIDVIIKMIIRVWSQVSLQWQSKRKSFEHRRLNWRDKIITSQLAIDTINSL